MKAGIIAAAALTLPLTLLTGAASPDTFTTLLLVLRWYYTVLLPSLVHHYHRRRDATEMYAAATLAPYTYTHTHKTKMLVSFFTVS